MSDDTITQLRVDALHESPFNPRKIFDEAALQELATDIAAQGRVLQPLLVRPRIPPLFAGDAEATAGHEIVFGHRRYRAAEIAGLATVPCMVRAMSDDEARRAQISENLQRKDVHPIEEAEGFQALIDNDNETADTIAEKFGKSRSYVYGRLKLLEACPEIRKACLAGEIGSEVALLVARLRTAKLQEKALAAIRAEWRAKLDDGGKASYRAIRDLLNEKFTLDLKGAMFDLEDEMLLPLAGNCVTCPKRSSNAPEFQDIAELGYSHSRVHYGPNVCTDPDCFDAKKKAHLQREADKLKADGKVVVTGGTARSAISAYGEIKGAYVALKDVQAELKKLPKKGSAAAQDKPAPEIVLIQDPRTGKTHKAVKVADVKAAGVKVKESTKSGKDDSWRAAQERANQEARRRQEAAKVATIANVEVLDRVLAAMATQPRTAEELYWMAERVFEGTDWDVRNLLAERHGFKKSDELEKVLAKWPPDKLALFAVECVLLGDAFVEPYALDRGKAAPKPELIHRCAKHYGVALPAEPAPTPSNAARADKKAKAGAKGKSKSKAAPGACEICGCTDDQACPGGCSWVRPGLCSQCAEQNDDAGVAGGSGAQVDLLEEAGA